MQALLKLIASIIPMEPPVAKAGTVETLPALPVEDLSVAAPAQQANHSIVCRVRGAQ